MLQEFDPYQAWLGIAPAESPPSHYRLLGMPEFTADADAIAEAAERLSERLKGLRPGNHTGARRKLLQHVEVAKSVLLNPTKKSLYDARLRAGATRAAAGPGNGIPIKTKTPVLTATVGARDDGSGDDLPQMALSVAALAAKIRTMFVRCGARLAAILSTRRRQQIRRWAEGASAAMFLACLGGGLFACVVLGYVSVRLFNRAKPPEANSRPRPAAADLDADLAAARRGRPSDPPPPEGQSSSSPSSESPEDNLLVARRLEHIRRALADRRIAIAKDHLEAAADEPQSQAQEIELTRLGALAELLDEFWVATLAAVNSVKAGDELQVAGQKLPVVQAAGETLTVQLGQFPTIFSCQNMPIDLAIGLAARQTTKDAAHAEAILGALQAMDAAGDRAEARRLWTEAAAAGEPVDTFAAELEIPLPADVHVAPQIARAMNRPSAASSQAEKMAPPVPGAGKSVAVVPAAPRAKRAAPDESRQQEIRSQFRQLYAAEFDLAKAAAAKARLAEKFLKLSGKCDGKPVSQFVLGNIARELAAEAGRVDLALRAIDAQDRSFVIDVFELKASILERISASDAGKLAGAAVVEASLSLIDGAVQIDEIEAAAHLARVGLEAAMASGDQARAKELRLRQRELFTLQKAFAEASPALDQLRDDPMNPAANRLVGNWYCLQKGNWPRGLPYLAQGDDPRLNELAKRELAAPSDPSLWQRLADGWQDLADGANGLAKLNLQRRARYWRERVLPTLQGDAKTAAQARLAALPDLAPPLEPPASVGELAKFSGRFQPDGHGVLAADGSKLLLLTDPRITVFDLSTGERRFLLAGHDKRLFDARLSADGRRAVSLGADDTLRVWDATNGEELRNFPVFTEGNAAHLVVSRDGKRVAFTTRNAKLLRVWDCETGKGLHQFAGGSDESPLRNISADGRRALAAGGGNVRIWDTLAGKESAVWDNRALGSASVGSLSGDGLFALLGAGKSLTVWRVSGKRELAHLTTTSAEITAVALSPDNRRALSGHSDATVALWDLVNQQRLTLFTGHTGSVEAVTFAPDGRRALSSSADGTVRVWGLPR